MKVGIQFQFCFFPAQNINNSTHEKHMAKQLRHEKADGSKYGQKNTICTAYMLIWNMDH